MTGGLIQLVAVSEQDKFLTGEPEVTFFKKIYKRHSNFAVETKEQILSDSVEFGKKNTCKISKDGDLISALAVNIDLGSLNTSASRSAGNVFSWVNSIGHAMIKYIEIEIGGFVIDKQYGEWFEIWNELTLPFDKKAGYNELVGKKDRAGYSYLSFQDSLNLIIPIKFWFSKNIGLAIPIVALTKHSIKINIMWEKFKRLWIANKSGVTPERPLFKASLLIDFVYLDVQEREKFAKENHIYLIEQIQFNNSTYFDKNVYNPNFKLELYHPTKELIWVCQRTDVLKRDDKDECNVIYGNDHFNYSRSTSFDTTEDFFESATLQINNMERFKALPAKYFRLYHPLLYHTKCPNNFVYCYSFSLKPEEHQPTGTCNFSNFDNTTLKLDMSNKNNESNYTIKLFAINYNLLIITEGMGGLAFSC